MPTKTTLLQMHVVSNPYPGAKEIQSLKTMCETCDRSIPSKNWNEHERSKRHQQAKKKAESQDVEVKTVVKRTEDWANDQSDNGLDATNGAAELSNGGENTWAANPTDGNEWGGNTGGSGNGGQWGDASADIGPAGDGFTTSQGRRAGRPGGRGGGRDEGGDSNCHKCGEAGHYARQCPQQDICFNCGLTGHMSRECPEPRKSRGGGGGACHNCGNEGHFSRECPEERKPREGGGGSRFCFNCTSPDHISSDCPEPRKGGGGPRTCYNCSMEGHISSECTEERKPRGGGGRVCYNCGMEGHMANDCTQERKPRERDPRGPKCYACQGYGHKKDACPEAGGDAGFGNGGYENDAGFGNDASFGDTGAPAAEWADDGDAAAPAASGGW